MKHPIYFLLTVVGLLGPATVFAQPELGPAPADATAAWVAQRLFDPTVEVQTAQFSGDGTALGYYQHATDLGLARGAYLTTGRIGAQTNFENVSQSAALAASTDNDGAAAHPDLSQLAGVPLFDVTELRVTFTPRAAEFALDYAWWSEHYAAPCAPPGDAFGIFLSGPGISGPYSNGAINLAQLPDGTPVGTATVNAGCGDAAFYAGSGSAASVYDGGTVRLRGRAAVVPCATYTLRVVVADTEHAQGDSGLFVEGGAGAPTVRVRPVAVSPYGLVAENCADGPVGFALTRTDATAPLVVPFAWTGTATPGTDFTAAAGSLTLPAGVDSLFLDVEVQPDAADEGRESLGVTVFPGGCAAATYWLFVEDPLLTAPGLPDELVVCEDETIDLFGENLTPDAPGLSFQTTGGPIPIPEPDGDAPGATLSSALAVSGLPAGTLSAGMIAAVCVDIDHAAAGDLDIYLEAPNGQLLLLSSDNGANGDDYAQTCFTPTATASITGGQANAPAPNAPFTGDFLPEGDWNDLYRHALDPNGVWTLHLTDDRAFFGGSLLGWSIAFTDLYRTTYSWNPAGELDCADCPNPSLTPTEDQTLVLTSTDPLGCSRTDAVVIDFFEPYASPFAYCVGQTPTSMTIGWEAVPNATGYEVRVDGGPWQPTNDQTFELTGLDLNQEVEFSIRGTGVCPGGVTLLQCATIDCETIYVNANVTPPACPGSATGTILLTATGGHPPYTFAIGSTTNTDGNFANLPGGEHLIVITDDIGCVQSLTMTLFDAPAPVVSFGVSQPLSCDQPTATVEASVSGGGSYTFAWSDGTTGSTLTTGQPGYHTVTATGSDGCAVVDSVLLDAAVELVATASGEQVCAGALGTLAVVVSAGQMPYTYLWSHGPMAATTEGAPGTYTVTVTDATGCELVLNASVGTPPEFTLQTSATGTDCSDTPDGTATVSTDGGTAPFAYLWNDPNAQTTATATALGGGLYTVTVTDANGCPQTASATVETPGSLHLGSATATAVSCAGGSDGTASVVVEGGNGVLSYQWDDPAGSTTPTLSDLPPGVYTVEVSDELGCSVGAQVSVSEPAVLTVLENTTPSDCNGAPTGSIGVQPGGGAGDYQLVWTDGATGFQRTDLAAGDYAYVLTDGNGCTRSDTATVEAAGAVVVQAEVSNVSCAGYVDGAIALSVAGGVAPYQVVWASGSLDTLRTGLAAGSYPVTIADAAGCSQTLILDVVGPAPVVVSSLVTAPRCAGDSTGTLELTANGGTPAYAYSLNGTDWQTEAVFTDLTAGSYQGSVRDAAGCVYSSDGLIQLPEPSALGSRLPDTLVFRFGETQPLEALYWGGTGAVAMRWTALNDTPLNCGDCPLLHLQPRTDDLLTLRLTDENDCTHENTVALRLLRDYGLYVPNGFSPNGDGRNDHFFPVAAADLEVLDFGIYDRWGNRLWFRERLATVGNTEGWNGRNTRGRAMNAGVYVYRMRVVFPDGHAEEVAGDVTLVR